MSRFSENLRRIRFERHMTQEEFADMLGTTKQNISRYESGAVSPKITTAEVMAEKLGISLSELNGEDDPLPSSLRHINSIPRYTVPMMGAVACGEPIYDKEVDVYVDSPVNCDVALTVRGDSMAPTYQDGDIVYIKRREEVPEKAVAVVLLDDEATLKHVYYRETGLTLLSDNMDYSPIMVEFSDYNRVRIFGVPVGFTRIYKPNINGKIKKGFK